MIILLSILALLTPAERDSLLAHTPGNDAFWSEVLSGSRGAMLDCIDGLFATIPRLDRLEMTSEALMDHVIGAMDSREIWFESMPDSIFLNFLLQYRFDEEPVSPYRTPLVTYWTTWIADTDTTVAAVTESIARSIGRMRVRPYDFMGGVASPCDVLASGGGTPVELRVLLGSSLRALGIPVRPVLGWFQGPQGRESGWLEYWNGDGWAQLPLLSDSLPDGFAGLSLAVAGGEYITGEIVPCGKIAFQPVSVASDSLLLAVSIPCPGRYVALDWLDTDPAVPCSVELGEGAYMIHLSRRLSSGAVRLASMPVDVVAGTTVPVHLQDLENSLH